MTNASEARETVQIATYNEVNALAWYESPDVVATVDGRRVNVVCRGGKSPIATLDDSGLSEVSVRIVERLRESNVHVVGAGFIVNDDVTRQVVTFHFDFATAEMDDPERYGRDAFDVTERYRREMREAIAERVAAFIRDGDGVFLGSMIVDAASLAVGSGDHEAALTAVTNVVRDLFADGKFDAFTEIHSRIVDGFRPIQRAIRDAEDALVGVARLAGIVDPDDAHDEIQDAFGRTAAMLDTLAERLTDAATVGVGEGQSLRVDYGNVDALTRCGWRGDY